MSQLLTRKIQNIPGKKSFGGHNQSGIFVDDFTVFNPKSSGVYQIKVSNADFSTDVKLVSGMTHPSGQPLFLKTLIISLVIAFIGAILFGASRRRIPLISGLPKI